MKESFEKARSLIGDCSAEEQSLLRDYLAALSPHPMERKWGVSADTILSAIQRSSDLTQRGVRGIIAEAVFETSVLPPLLKDGWMIENIDGDLSYDVHLGNGSQTIRIQIKLQRLEKGLPKYYYPKKFGPESFYVVEVQKTRSGTKTMSQPLPGIDSRLNAITSTVIKTRPYSFEDFDILAVNMHPSCNDWTKFRFTVASWLLPRSNDPKLIEIFQPVSKSPTDVWTDSLTECIQWLNSGEKRKLLPQEPTIS